MRDRNGLLMGVAALLVACGGSGGGGRDDGGGDGGGVVDAMAADANPAAPTCVIETPADGTETAFDEPVMLMASASDPQDGTLGGASVVWRTDLQVAPLGNGTSLATTLPPGTNVVTCTATDSTGNTGSDSITIVSKSPVARINHPGDGEMRPASMDVPFTGLGRDLEDGPLTGGALVWTSSIDGQFGTGENFNAMLSAGTHTITLTVTDSGGNPDTDTITLIMTP